MAAARVVGAAGMRARRAPPLDEVKHEGEDVAHLEVGCDKANVSDV